MWAIYILQHSEKGELYIGFTSNLKRRIDEHNAGETTSTRRKNGIWKLVYCELYRSKADAHKRETRLKHHGRAKQELLKRIAESLGRE